MSSGVGKLGNRPQHLTGFNGALSPCDRRGREQVAALVKCPGVGVPVACAIGLSTLPISVVMHVASAPVMAEGWGQSFRRNEGKICVFAMC
jgi:hypothetical protein